MNRRRVFLPIYAGIAACSFCLNASALNLTTVAINDYNYTGGGASYDAWHIQEAQNAADAFKANGHYHANWFYEGDAKASLFIGLSARIRGSDVVYYVGHGGPKGPFLGNGPEYSLMEPGYYFWGDIGVRWFISSSCLNLFEGDRDGTYYSRLRWLDAMAQGAGTMHALIASEAISYSSQNQGKDFFYRTLRDGQSVGQAWFDSTWTNQYMWWGWMKIHDGVLPALFCSYANRSDYFYESMRSPWPDPKYNSPTPGNYTYHNQVMGTPRYY